MSVRIDEKKMVDECTNLYSVSKTLRFELRPQGKTLDYIKRDGILETDEHRAESYQKVKEIIDRYHKKFIEDALTGLTLTGLKEYQALYQRTSRDEKQEKEFEKIQASLRKQITKCFTEHPCYKKMFKKEMISEELISFTQDNPEEQAFIKEFLNYSTYFKGFFENRKNMYSDEPKASAIAYRMIHQNLPKYLDNCKNYALVKELEGDKILTLQENLKEKKQIESIDEFFSLDGFTKVLTQSGIDQYNLILGAYSEEGGVKIQGLNEYINLHNQKCDKGAKKLPKMKQLYKQILSDRESASFVLNKFETDQEVLSAVSCFYEQMDQKVLHNKEEMPIEEVLSKLSEYHLEQIYLSNDGSLETISQYLFGNWSVLKQAIEHDYDQRNFSLKEKKSAEKYAELKDKELKRKKVYAITEINSIAENYLGERVSVERYFAEQIADRTAAIDKAYEGCDCLKEEYSKEMKLSKDSRSIEQLKNLLDKFKELQGLLIPFLQGKEESVKDELFYGEIIRVSDVMNPLNYLYDKVRNYVTRKPYSLQKTKLNFAKSTLLDGWDRNKEKDNLGVILLKDDMYYLGIMNRNWNRVMEEAPKAVTGNVYQKMEYKLLPGPNKMLPKVFFSKSRKEEFSPDEELLERYEKGTHKKGDNFSLDDCHRLIDFFKASINKHNEWREFDFHFSDTESYEDISGFYREVEHQGYKLTFKDIDADYINNLVENGQLYLFQIYNKDFSQYSKGKPNLHTLYWKMVFSPENLANPVYKLNGEAEVFYRKASIADQDIVRHEAGSVLDNKYPKAKKATSKFNYELIKDRRFTVDKFQFHVPITMNFQAEGENYVNRKVRRLIHERKNLHVIGIDRGERNLLYLSVIDMDGNIVEQRSLNTVHPMEQEDDSRDKDYHAILSKREEDNAKARRNWQEINNIKDLKEGYLSQVIHEIAMLMIRYDAIVVLEDLNFGFKRSRQKVERQVYQKFEKMLIDKLNYLVDKNVAPSENGGLLHAYQLTEKFESFAKMNKQSGFLFYVPAWNTSKLDPTTGFVNLFDTQYVNKENVQKFIRKFDSINYNKEYCCFDFSFDYLKFTEKAAGSRTKWCICSEGKRIERFKNLKKPKNNTQWENRKVDLTDCFRVLFEQYQIDWQNGDLVQKLIAVENAEFYRGFMHIFSLMVQIRNSDENSDEIVSPVRNASGICFKSVAEDNSDGKQYPKDADANGAYNIAKKGLWIMKKLQTTPEEKLDKVNLTIPNKEWLAYAQEHTI